MEGGRLGGQRLGRSCPCSPFNRDHHHGVDHSDGVWVVDKDGHTSHTSHQRSDDVPGNLDCDDIQNEMLGRVDKVDQGAAGQSSPTDVKGDFHVQLPKVFLS